jgi:hypothetical protein
MEFIHKKKGIMLNQAFPAVLALVLIAMLVIIAIFLFSTLQSSSTFTTGDAAYNATGTMITQFAAYPALVGLVGIVIFLGLVIGVLIGSFVFGGRKGV